MKTGSHRCSIFVFKTKVAQRQITNIKRSVSCAATYARVMKSNVVAEKHFLLAEENQQKEKYSEALENFNLCLCHAPAGSSFIYASLICRSTIYYKVKQYRCALDNLYWANEIKPFDDDCHDLLEMVRICEEEMLRDPMPTSSMDFFDLTLPVNEKVPFISACLELKKNEVYGRYFSTNKDLNPGDVIVAEEPFFKVIATNVCHLRCCICCSTNLYSLIQCGSCSRAMFCSSQCKRSTIHARECEASAKDMDTLEEYLLQRMFYQAIDICGSIEQLESLVLSETNDKTILDFDFRHTTNEVKKKKIILAVSGLDKRDPGSLEAYSRFQKVIDRLITETGAKNDFLNNYLIKCLQSLTVNFFHFQWNASADAEAKGLALCTLAAFFSHSCDPNIEKIDVDNKFIFVARKPIKAGEQLNMCYDKYDFMKYSLVERQQYLNDVYKFKCNCAACVNDYSTYNFNFKETQFQIEEAKTKYRKNCEFIQENISFHPNENICRVIEENVYLLSYVGNRLPF